MVAPVFATHVVIQHPAVGCPMQMGLCDVHPIPFDRAGHAADKDDGPVGFHHFDNAHMGERIVVSTVAVRVPRVIKEDQIAGSHDRAAMKSPVFPKMIVNEPHAIRSAVLNGIFVQIDTVSQIDGSSHSRTIVCDAASIALDGFRADQADRSTNDGLLTAVWRGGPTASGYGGDRGMQRLGRRSGTGREGRQQEEIAKRADHVSHTHASIADSQR